MRKSAISVTLDADNLTWLRVRAAAARGASVSRVLDEIVAGARAAANGPAQAPRSVAGTVRIPPTDRALARADAAVRALFDAAPGRSRA